MRPGALAVGTADDVGRRLDDQIVLDEALEVACDQVPGIALVVDVPLQDGERAARLGAGKLDVTGERREARRPARVRRAADRVEEAADLDFGR